ncbi:TaqI-like C-terminal specificity domain-containing protein [uncultured Alistipes sp.]|uniref:TaqI-like C-terminal specificity domain-containing protein n=1 Tax=uncultured Alistipes sp. TaxID=538949 RepID=UPI002618BE96|nr:TaqI-like C-terminal specificity domain-containing protein [uncultured Alistipes sp.]
MRSSAFLISDATRKNWKRLCAHADGKLTSRANKTRSTRTILPIEYFADHKNIEAITALCETIREHRWSNENAIYSIGINLLKRKGIIKRAHVAVILSEHHYQTIEELLDYPLPTNEPDLPGLIYQCLLSEGEKSIRGAYYTPISVASRMTKDFVFSSKETFLDPCCGSGIFLLSLRNASPEQIFGIDSDPIAVFAARINLLLKFSDQDFTPQIYCLNYLRRDQLSKKQAAFFTRRFDYIGSNPPWGAIPSDLSPLPEIRSKETFSYFLVRSFEQLKPAGTLRFLLPDAILKIDAHKDIRSFLLTCGDLRSTTFHDESFAGVYTKYIDIEFKRTKPTRNLTIRRKEETRRIVLPETVSPKSPDLTFIMNTDQDTVILEHLESRKVHDLSASDWALGIVTGNNRKFLKDLPENDLDEPIYTGKEVSSYVMNPARKYIRYDNKAFQQIAPEKYYRAPEKLIYKFISDKPVFAYDNRGALCLNSANILIPNIPNMSIKTVLAFLNSDVFRYFYKKNFADIKILKCNLIKLPFPHIEDAQNELITDLANRHLAGDKAAEKHIQQIIYSIFGLSATQIAHIKTALYGTASE